MRSLPVLPLHVLFGLASLGVGCLLYFFDPHRRYDGQVILLYLVLHEGAKFGFELFRHPPSQLLQLSSLTPALVGAVMLAVLARRHAQDGAAAT